MKFREFFPKKEESEKKPFKSLPFDVRYALEYRGAEFEKKEIESLIGSGFGNEGLYLMIKSLKDNPEIQKEFLEKYIEFFVNTNKSEISSILLQEYLLEILPQTPVVPVDAAKLSQISHQGFEMWQEKFTSIAQKFSTDERNIFIIAHSMMIGLNAFLKAFSETEKSFQIIIPERLLEEHMGYIVYFEKGKAKVDWLAKPFNDITGSVLIDDTKNSGLTLDNSKNYLERNGLRDVQVEFLNQVDANKSTENKKSTE